ncbi:MAG: carbohydrate ABC transporter permease [Bacilli bacterium]|nr:carbohydrate ABC transporter permease [Bacilli bacterium]MDD3121848.1 carbohydrate ABC transporter permease [Bacilli bacterium]MDD4063663.1 carbohydrate ABC transporter permease [Bacilli bacterium]MDD5183130.1 carbohydrate ABC transporter permease [Bacilli bacterium]MDY0363651.1 carbohydrate ABC transporter permease [Bacilli bacterium]
MDRELYFDEQQLKKFKAYTIVTKIFTYTFLIILALFIIIPFYWMIATSLKTTAEVISQNISFFPRELTFASYAAVFERAPLFTMYMNTILVGFFTTSLTIVSVIFAAFAFSRLKFKGREVIFSILLMTMMIPGEVFVITNYMTVNTLGWIRVPEGAPLHEIIGNYAAMILPFVGSIFYTFFLRQTFRQIPNELYLAAKVDGLGDFKYLFKVMVPIAKSTIITITILSMIGTWNAYIWPSLVTSSSNSALWLVSNGLNEVFRSTIELSGPNSVLNQQMAGSALVTLPLLVVFFLLKDYIMKGVSRSGIKG